MTLKVGRHYPLASAKKGADGLRAYPGRKTSPENGQRREHIQFAHPRNRQTVLTKLKRGHGERWKNFAKECTHRPGRSTELEERKYTIERQARLGLPKETSAQLPEWQKKAGRKRPGGSIQKKKKEVVQEGTMVLQCKRGSRRRGKDSKNKQREAAS